MPSVILSAAKDLSWEISMMYYVYMLTNWNNRVLYSGVTNDLNRRLYEHRHKLIDGLTRKNAKSTLYAVIPHCVKDPDLLCCFKILRRKLLRMTAGRGCVFYQKTGMYKDPLSCCFKILRRKLLRMTKCGVNIYSIC
jgi:hypothetical protein